MSLHPLGGRSEQEREDHILDCYETIKQRDAEIERLRAALSVAGLWRDMGEENKRLKAALREIADQRYEKYGAYLVARAALEGEFPTKICPECGQPMREGDYCDHTPF